MPQPRRARPLSLKNHPKYSAGWLKKEITDDPSILGLGDFPVIDIELGRPRTDQLALVLHDRQADTRYEVVIQLGTADESHVLRTIEYWDIEKSRNPTSNHVAVIVAENITPRLLDTVGRLDKSIPIIAIQLNAWEVGDTAALGATRFLDLTCGAATAESSPPGEIWTNRDGAANNQWASVAYGSGMFVAVASTGVNRVMTSPDGITWTARAAATNNRWTSVAYGNGLFVAVSMDGGNRVMTSPDGITWTARAAAEDSWWRSVAYGRGMFVAVSSTEANQVMTSPDGITWTVRAAGEPQLWSSVTHGSGVFVAVAFGGTDMDRVMTSPDGITWTARAAVKTNQWRSVAYGCGVFVAVSDDEHGFHLVMTSPDGIAWSARCAGADTHWVSVTYGNGLFVAVCWDATNRVMTSPDGITWTVRSTAGDNSWSSVTYGNGMFVAVARYGANQVMTSGALWTVPDAPTDVTAKARDRRAIVSWTPPSDDGGTPVTGYTVTASPGGVTCSKLWAHSCTVVGLTNGTAYTFTVTATNAAGTSIASAPSAPITPKKRPIPPPGT